MRRLAALLLVPVLALTAAACGDDDGGGKIVTPTVSGAFGQKPEVNIPKGEAGDESVVEVLIEGTGPEIKKDDYVVADTLGVKWDGTKVGSTYDAKAYEIFQAGDPQLSKGIREGVIGKKVGSRLMVIVPPAESNTDQPLVLTLDLHETKSIDKNAVAKGDEVKADPALPQVKAEPGKAAEITIPQGAKADKLIVKPLIEGTGPEVKSGQTLVAQYTGVLFDGGKKFDSSWDHGGATTFPIGVGQVIKGWDEGLVGQKVGSRVLLVIPADKGYGAEGQGEIPANAPLVFVVDIIDALGGSRP